MKITRSMEGWEGFASLDIRADKAIRAIPVGGARFVVTIDGRPYAGFVNRDCAEQAVRLWAGEVNGCGVPVPDAQRAQSGWLAARGHCLAVVER